MNFNGRLNDDLQKETRSKMVVEEGGRWFVGGGVVRVAGFLTRKSNFTKISAW